MASGFNVAKYGYFSHLGSKSAYRRSLSLCVSSNKINLFGGFSAMAQRLNHLISTLELLSCSVACSAGSSCLSRFGSCSNGGIGDCGTGDTGTAEADVGGAEVGFSPEAEDVEGVMQECGIDLSPGADSKPKGQYG